MGNAQNEMKRAVEAGYWHLYRYNPLLKEEGKNPFILDSKEPTQSFRDYLLGETRYAALTRTFPDIAEELFAKPKNLLLRNTKYTKNWPTNNVCTTIDLLNL